MKLLLLTLDFPPGIGGIQTLLYNLCQSFDRFEPIVVAPRKGEEEEFDTSQPFKIHRVGSFSCSSSRIVKLLFLLLMLIKAFAVSLLERIDVVLWNHVTARMLELVLRYLYGKPYIVCTQVIESVNWNRWIDFKKSYRLR